MSYPALVDQTQLEVRPGCIIDIDILQQTRLEVRPGCIIDIDILQQETVPVSSRAEGNSFVNIIVIMYLLQELSKLINPIMSE